jgi:hypothetical protein
MNAHGKVDKDEAVELNDEVALKPRRRGSPVVAVRVAPELLDSVAKFAEQTGLTVSDVFRAGAERLIHGTVAGPTFVSGTLVVMAGGKIVQGSPSSGIGRSRQEIATNPSFVGTFSE